MSAHRILAVALVACAAFRTAAAQLPPPPKGPTPVSISIPTPAPTPTPAPAPVLSIVGSPTIYPYQKVDLQMKIEHFPFTDLDRNRLPLHLGAFTQFSSITYGGPPVPRAKDGSIAFSVIGYFPTTSSIVTIRASGLGSRKSEDSSINVSARATLADRRTYTVTNTWSLKDRLAPSLLHFGVGSFCNGKPPVGSELGIVERGGKLTFFGRSGPVGTECVFVLKEWFERNGIIGAKWRVEKAGPGEQCKQAETSTSRGMAVIGDNGEARGGDTLLSDARDVTTSDGVVFARDNTDPVSVLLPAMVGYTCPVTLGTDVRTIRFVLDEVTLLAPPGRSFP